MRLTLFWTFLYSTIGFIGLTIFNMLLLNHPIIKDEGLVDNILVNQQLTHIIGILVLAFLIVHFYYEKHPRGQFNAKKSEIKAEHPDIPDTYFEDPKDQSIDQRYTRIVNDNGVTHNESNKS